MIILLVWWYYLKTSNNSISKEKAIFSKEVPVAIEADNSLKIQFSAEDYQQVTDPEEITVNAQVVGIENRIQLWSILKDSVLDKPTWTFDTIETIKLSELDGYTMIYSLPSLDTPVCTKQTKQIEYAWKQFEDVNFVTLSHDMPFALKRFCGDNNITNVMTLSDGRSKDFAKSNWLYMTEYDLMTRAVVIINENLEVVYVDYADEVTQDVDLVNAFAFLESL